MAEKQWDSPPEMQIDPSKAYRVTVESSQGVIELELYPEHAPKTVNNFVFLGLPTKAVTPGMANGIRVVSITDTASARVVVWEEVVDAIQQGDKMERLEVSEV